MEGMDSLRLTGVVLVKWYNPFQQCLEESYCKAGQEGWE